MDTKSVFFNDYLMEKVCLKQPPGVERFEYPNHVNKLDTAFYGLKKAPKSWYGILSSFISGHGNKKEIIDNTLFMRSESSKLLIVQIYTNDRIFGATDDVLCKWFFSLMSSEFGMNMMGELIFFLGLQIIQTKTRTSIHLYKYIKELLKKFEMDGSKTNNTPIVTTSNLIKMR